MSKLAIVLNNSGFPVGAFSMEPGCGGERLLPAVEMLAFAMGFTVLLSEGVLTVIPKEIRDEVAAFVFEKTGIKSLEQIKSPPRG